MRVSIYLNNFNFNFSSKKNVNIQTLVYVVYSQQNWMETSMPTCYNNVIICKALKNDFN